MKFISHNITAILTGALVFAFSLVRAQNDPPKAIVDQVIAVVADEIVLQSELEAAILQYVQSGQPIEEGSRCLIFEDILYKKLLVNQAAVDSVEVSEDQIKGEIDRRLQYFIQQIGSERKLEEFYGKSIPEIRDEFHDLIQEQMLVQQMQGSITQDVDVSPVEVRDFSNKIPKDSLPFFSTEVEVGHIVKLPIVNEDARNATIDLLKSLDIA